jgi:hypothetical protein
VVIVKNEVDVLVGDIAPTIARIVGGVDDRVSYFVVELDWSAASQNNNEQCPLGWTKR